MSLRGWSYIAQLVLSVEALVLLALVLLIAYFLVRGMNAVLNALPAYLRQAQQAMEQARRYVEMTSRLAAAPFIAVGSFAAKVRGLWLGVRRWLAGDLFS